mmetsp:Transcript_71029/g.205653  ORF Transcript_71029/g.205653 Transcript_71029/m.205653 type:complete len:472 (+) Transcript_71029:42-1457(+)
MPAGWYQWVLLCGLILPATADVLRLSMRRERHTMFRPAAREALQPLASPGNIWHEALLGSQNTTIVPSEVAGEMLFAERQDFHLQLTNFRDMFYTVVVSVGFPPRPMRLLVDTGSSNLLVLPAGPVERQGRSVVLNFGHGGVVGQEVWNKMCIAELCLDDQVMVTVTAVREIPLFGKSFDGLLGLGFPALSGLDAATFLQDFAEKGPFKPLAFGLNLGRGEEESSLLIGSLDEVKAAAPGVSDPASEGVALSVLPVGPEAKWWLVHGSVDILTGSASVYGILDSGTSFLAIPGWLLPHVLTTILPDDSRDVCGMGADGALICPCSMNMRPLTMRFAGHDSSELVMTLTSADLLRPGPPAMCIVSVVPAPAGFPFCILGDTFLRRVYAVHDVEGKQVVLYPKGGGVVKKRRLHRIWPPAWWPFLLVEDASLGSLVWGAAVGSIGVVAALATALVFHRRRQRTSPPPDCYMPL